MSSLTPNPIISHKRGRLFLTWWHFQCLNLSPDVVKKKSKKKLQHKQASVLLSAQPIKRCLQVNGELLTAHRVGSVWVDDLYEFLVVPCLISHLLEILTLGWNLETSLYICRPWFFFSQDVSLWSLSVLWFLHSLIFAVFFFNHVNAQA